MSDRRRDVLLPALRGAARGALERRGELRYRFARDLWTLLKRFGAEHVRNVEIRDVPALDGAVAEAFVDDRTRGVLAALCRALDCRTVFEIGTAAGRTTWSIARTCPEAKVWTLDLPAADPSLDVLDYDRPFMLGDARRGNAFRGTPEEERIEQLLGDSATFDFSPWEGRIDLVFVDGAHSLSYVRNDTEAAFRMLSERGTIVWDDYPHFPGVYGYLNELARTEPVHHLFDTRLAVLSRSDLFG